MSTVLVRVSVVTCQREFDICHNFMIPHNGAGVLEYEGLESLSIGLLNLR